MSKKNNFIFWGTPDVASQTLEVLKKNGYLPLAIVTSVDKPQGRKMLLTPSPVKLWAIENDITYIQPEKLDGEFFSKLSGMDYQLSIVVAYGKIIPENIINMPELGSINIHYSLLPKYRGASPVESAILNGDMETGVTIQKMKYKMDSGPILSTEKIKILSDEKAFELRNRLIKVGADLLVKVLPNIYQNNIKPIEQNEANATFCKKIKKEDGLISLNDDSVKNFNKFRAYFTWPKTFFFQDEKRIIITEALLENNKFIIKKIIPEGKKETNYKE